MIFPSVSFCMSPWSSLFPSLMSTLVIGFETNPNPGWLHFKVIILVLSAKKKKFRWGHILWFWIDIFLGSPLFNIPWKLRFIKRILSLGSDQKLAKELKLLSCGAGEDFEIPFDSKEIKPVNPKRNQPWIFKVGLIRKDWCWSCSFNTLATWCKKPTH